MSKQHGNETIKVRFSTNGIMPSLEDQDELEERGKEVLWLVFLYFRLTFMVFLVIQHLKLFVSDQERNQFLLHVKWKILHYHMRMIPKMLIHMKLSISRYETFFLIRNLVFETLGLGWQ